MPGIPGVPGVPGIPAPPGSTAGTDGDTGAADQTGDQAGGAEGTPEASGAGGTTGDDAESAGGAGTDATSGTGTAGAEPASGGDRAGDDGWVTSNEIPGVPQGKGSAGQGAGDQGEAGGSAADGALDKALEGLDGEIMAERAVIRSRANASASTSGEPTDRAGSGGAPSGDAAVAGAGNSANLPRMPAGVPAHRTAPPGPPVAAAGPVPEDIPVAAQDDDIIARQLREAAMKETDPELREKLWAEYRRYKGL
jgi:hypothetical protein